MQAAGVEDRVRTAAQTIYQALIDAELTSVIGAGRGSAVRWSGSGGVLHTCIWPSTPSDPH